MDLPGLLTEIAFRHIWQGLLIIGFVSLLLLGRKLWSAEHRSWFWTACLVLSAALPFLTLVKLPDLELGQTGTAQGGPAITAAGIQATDSAAADPAFLASLAGLADRLPLGILLSLLVSVWLGVMVWKLFRIAAAARQTRNLEATLEPCALSLDMLPPDWPVEIEVLQSRAVGTPMAIGFFNCRVVLPTSLISTLPPHQIRHVLSHELAHIRRGDLQFAMIQRVIEAIFWWSPLTWFIGTRLRDEREMACDDRAVHMNGCSRQYATALLESVTVLVADRKKLPCDVLAMSAFDHHSGGAFRTRIRRLIQNGYRARTSIGRVQVAGFSTAGLAVMALFFLTPREVFDSHVLSPSEPAVIAGNANGPIYDMGTLVEFDVSLPAILQELTLHTPETARPPAKASVLSYGTRSASRSPVTSVTSASASTEECSGETAPAPETKALVTAALERARIRERTVDLPQVEVTTETEVIAQAGRASAKGITTTTEVIITTEENGIKTVRRMVRQSDAKVLTIVDSNGTTLTMTIGEGADGTQLVEMTGGPGQVVAFD